MSDNHQAATAADLPAFVQFAEDIEDAFGLESFDPNDTAYRRLDAIRAALNKLNNALHEASEGRRAALHAFLAKKDCNRHINCEASRSFHKEATGAEPGAHFCCHDDECEDCFGK